jgi:cobalt-zinc-cadmium efflux system protein
MAHKHEHHQASTNNIRIAFFLNLGFTILEIFGGLWTNSLAILSDAVHDLGDSLSLGLAWFLDRYSKRTRDERYSYGYRRFSMLGALVNTIVLIVGAFLVLSRAIPRLLEPEQSNAPGMVAFALIGIVINGVAVLRLRGDKSMNARVVAWHLLEDVFGWVAVLIVAVILLFADVPILDPILSIVITAYVLYNVVKNLSATLSLFLQGVPEGYDIDTIEKDIKGVENVQSTHHTHIWSLDGEHHVLTTHIVVDEETSKEQVLCLRDDIRDLLKFYEFSHLTVEIEFGDKDCGMA